MTETLTAAGLDRLRDAMATRVAAGEMPGIVTVVTVVADDEDARVDAIGLTTFGGTEPMRRDTIFRIASMTKPILAAATLMLIETGELALDDRVDRFLPELAGQRVLRHVDGPLDDTVPLARPITVEDLLTFRMGFGHLFEPTYQPPFPIINAANDLRLVIAEPDPRTPHPPDEWIRLFGSLPLMLQPGERWQYNVGSLVLGVLVARVAGQTLGDLLDRLLFTPLGMRDTGFETTPERAAGLPGYYLRSTPDGPLEMQTNTGPDLWSRPQVFPSGAGGLLSTADDFLAFARMLTRGGTHDGQRLLSAESVSRMTANQLTPEQIATAGPLLGGGGWGYGVAVSTTPDEVSAVPGHYGWAGGYGTTWINDPHRRRTGIALTQVSEFMWNGGLAEFEKLAMHA